MMNIIEDQTNLKPDFPVSVRKQLLYRKDNCEGLYHWHPFCEISTLLSGKGRYYVNGKEYTLEKGDLIIFNNIEPHGWEVTSNTMELMVMIFSPAFIASSLDFFDGKYMQPFHSRGTNFQNKVSGTDPNVPKIAALMQEVWKESIRQDTGFQLMIKAKILEILALLTRHYQRDSLKDTPPLSPRTRKYMKRLEDAFYYINAHYTEDLTLEAVANQVYLSPNYFSTSFKQTTGIGFREYLIRLRLKHAQELKSNSDLTTKELAESCGFHTISSYYKMLRKYSDYI